MGSLTESSKASIVAIETENKDPNTSISSIPRKMLVLGSADTSYLGAKDKIISISKAKQAERFGVGSQLHQMLKGIFDTSLSFEVYASAISEAEDASEATADITVTGTATKNGTIYIYIGGIRVSVNVKTGEDASQIHNNMITAISSVLDVPVKAADGTDKVTLTSKWKGKTANEITLSQGINEEETNAMPEGISLTFSSETLEGGLGDVSLEKVLSEFDSTYYTSIATAFTDTENLNLLMDRSEELFSATEKRGFYVVGGYNEKESDYISLVENRNDKYYCAFWAEQSITPKYMIAALACRSIENSLAESVAVAFGGAIDGIIAGKSPYRKFEEIDDIVRKGGSYSVYNSYGEVLFKDTFTTYKTADDGSESNAYSFLQTIGKLQVLQYEMNDVFSKAPYYKAVLVSDEASVRSDVNAVKPKTAKATLTTLIRDWEGKGLLNNATSSIENITAQIGSAAGRLEVGFMAYFSTPLGQVDIKVDWTLQVNS
ncbi:hypothetical protein BFL38_14400 [Brachyspira hampsonii]|uniref:Phage tail protein n=1 Tax=Brachyspira hampsonii TaxID=1287055 RepID=A0A1E5NH31_9SPIR|nr:hypothetical protein [Brachyspira hampsonii]OEJ15475.1 hypothetical protein BFL38_14400 [Brachyspira hampsonii]